MLLVQNIFWWLAFLFCGIILQLYVPGLDALVVGIILVTRERDYKTMVWLVPAVVILQEGMGSLSFGFSIFYIASFFLLHRLSMAIALASRLVFYLLVSAGMGCLHSFYAWFFATLQNVPFDENRIIHDGVLQTFYILVAWPVLGRLRRLVVRQLPWPEGRGHSDDR